MVDNSKIWTRDKLINSLVLLKNNEIYRVADILNVEYRESKFIRRLKKEDCWKNTIMKDYVEATNARNDFNLLYNLIVKKTDECMIEPYDDDYLLVHIRTGDDINGRGLANKDNYNFYLSKIKELGKDKKIVLVTALHFGHHEKNRHFRWIYKEDIFQKNIDLLLKLIHEIPYSIEILSSEEVDSDLIYLSLAKNLLVSEHSGGFSNVVKQVNKIHISKIG